MASGLGPLGLCSGHPLSAVTHPSGAEAFPGIGVEDVHVVGVGGHVDRRRPCARCRVRRPARSRWRGALHAAGAVDERIRAELLDHGDLDREPAVLSVTIAPRLGAHADHDVALHLLRGRLVDRHEVVADLGLAVDGVAPIRFICGEPMKPATNRLTGRS